jgi:protein phosphatase
MKLKVFTHTEQGPRDYQQDRILVKEGLLVIADGMGGHANGDLAAKKCIEAFTDLNEISHKAFEKALVDANAACQSIGGPRKMSDYRRSPGSTCTVVHMSNDECIWMHVGDTRISVVLPDQDIAVTKDQGSGHTLYNCVGSLQLDMAAGGSFTGLKLGDAVVLTTDGVHDALGKDLFNTVRMALAHGFDPAVAIVKAALIAGSQDNCTAIVAVVQED